jgi:hypothetical protein
MSAISEPSKNDIIAWWNWAAGFSRQTSPFERGWGNSGIDRNNVNQNANLFCISCTAGNGGRDNVSRPLRSANESNKGILVPVFVSSGDVVGLARKLLGRVRGGQAHPAVEFFVNGEPVNYFYEETEVGQVTFVSNNSFGEPANQPINVVSTGFWAVVEGDITSLEFGGTGGERNPNNAARFDTGVIYR